MVSSTYISLKPSFRSHARNIESNLPKLSVDEKVYRMLSPSPLPLEGVIFALMNFFVAFEGNGDIWVTPFKCPTLRHGFAHKYPLTPPFHLRFAVINISCNDFCTILSNHQVCRTYLVIESKLPSERNIGTVAPDPIEIFKQGEPR